MIEGKNTSLNWLAASCRLKLKSELASGVTVFMKMLKNTSKARFYLTLAGARRFSLRGTRHVPGSQPPFPSIPDPDQNKEDASFISVVAYDVYIPLSLPI